MIDVQIGKRKVDAGDLEAVFDAARETIVARTEQILAAKEVTREELITGLNAVMSTALGVYVALGSLLLIREQSGLYDEALRSLRDILAISVGAGAANRNEVEPGIIIPDGVGDGRTD